MNWDEKQKNLVLLIKRSQNYGNSDEKTIYEWRKDKELIPVYKKVDTCAGEFESETPYFYGTYEMKMNQSEQKKKVLLSLGSGPIRIGQGIEFDYATVH